MTWWTLLRSFQEMLAVWTQVMSVISIIFCVVARGGRFRRERRDHICSCLVNGGT